MFLLLFAASILCMAQEYPAKTVRVIAPFPPGGSVDTVGRLIAARLSESYGQQFVVDNRPGASGSIGTDFAASAPPDGYTLLINTIPLVTNGMIFRRARTDVLSEFTPISLLTTTTSLLAVHPSLPVKNTSDLLQLARTRPGTLNYGTAGVGTNPHIAGELLNYLGKVDIAAVHYKGGGPALIAAVSGEVTIAVSTFPDTYNYVRAGRLRAIGVTSLKRAAQLPTVQAISEVVPGYEFTTWQGLLAPRNTPRLIVEGLSVRIRKLLATPAETKRYADMGLDITAGTPEDFAVFLRKETEKWSKVISERGMKTQ